MEEIDWNYGNYDPFMEEIDWHVKRKIFDIHERKDAW